VGCQTKPLTPSAELSPWSKTRKQTPSAAELVQHLDDAGSSFPGTVARSCLRRT
jgi:hypothetical protein